MKLTRLHELKRLTAEIEARKRARQAAQPGWETPGDLARLLDPATVQTPALDVVDQQIMWAYTTPGARLIVSLPPQEGKSSRVTKIGSLWALARNPELRLGIASYAQPLAEGFGRDVRNWITTFNGDEGSFDLGLRIASDYGSAKRWQLDGHRGGVVCVGIGCGLTGRPLDALVIDDPFSDKSQADSAYYRERVWGWWQSVGSTRLAPGAPGIVILTRWHEDDLAGRFLAAEDGHRWRVINIPALADHDPNKGQTDPLGREPGEWLASARGRTAAEWEQIRIQAGSRVFAALYQGRPSPDAGNVWQRHWWRRYTAPLWSQHPDRPGRLPGRRVRRDDHVVGHDVQGHQEQRLRCRPGVGAPRRERLPARPDPQTAELHGHADRVQGDGEPLAAGHRRSMSRTRPTAPRSSTRSGRRSPASLPVTPTESKYARANAVAPFIEAGNVFLPEPAIALFDPEEFVDEAAGFPNAAHDDQVDATSQALAEMLLDGTGAQAWIDHLRHKVETAGAPAVNEAAPPAAPTTAESAPEDPAEARRRARTAAFRQHR